MAVVGCCGGWLVRVICFLVVLLVVEVDKCFVFNLLSGLWLVWMVDWLVVCCGGWLLRWLVGLW